MKLQFSSKFTTRLFLLLTAFLTVSQAQATLISGDLTVDNQQWVYLSTDDSVQGDFVSSGNNWGATDSISATLAAGVDYFLHIRAEDVGGIAGFIGDFSLDSSEHVFANGLSYITTNNSDWNVSTSGWSNYSSATTIANHGGGPWGWRPNIDSSAQWIWSSDAYNHNNVYFSLAITATTPAEQIPTPTSLAVFAFGLMAFALRRKVQA